MTDLIPRPRADRTQLQQIIVGLTEGIIIINPDQTIAWANEAALAMHGIGTIADLGSTVSEYRERYELRYRNRHKLPAGDYPMDRVVSGEAFSEVVVEVARPGEDKHWVHQIRSLVLTDPEGHPDCLVLVMADETERFSAENRFERMFAANPAPALIVRLSDMRYVRVNQGFMEMTGYGREALVGRSMHEVDILEGAEKRPLAVERLHAGITIPQMEARLRVPAGIEKTVLLAGQPIEVGEDACMLFTFADLHPRQQAEDALRHSQEQFAKAFRMAPGPMAIIALDGLRILDVNNAFTAATGWRREEVIGRDEVELAVWGQDETRTQLERQVRETGHIHSADVQLRSKDGRVGHYLLSAETVTIHNERCVLSVMLDITDRKHTEMQLLAAIESVMQDTSWFGQKIVEKLTSLTRSGDAAPAGPAMSDLTTRAREVLGLVAEGLSDKEIAARLGVAQQTVRNHVSAIYSKLGVHRRSMVIVWARERGLGSKLKSLTMLRKSKRRADRQV
ncbi:MAG: PAS domain S-box protein [Pseudomonadota bacterium]|nr:PAS domain S-box protein [Pseudomonadota bacterium]